MSPEPTPRRSRTSVRVDSKRGVFMISVAAELAHMHPQTLRTYEARGLEPLKVSASFFAASLCSALSLFGTSISSR